MAVKAIGMPKIKIVPSVLSADFSRLQEDVDRVRNADAIQFDIMDGHFVPPITFGHKLVGDVRTRLVKDIHLMVEHPEKYIASFSKAGAGVISFHIEAARQPRRIISMIKRMGIKAGIAIRPETPASATFRLLPYVDQVIVFSAGKIGFGGGELLQKTYSKVRQIRKRFAGDIQLDGGINAKTISLAVQAGANSFVAGSFVFGAKNPAARVELLRRAAMKNGYRKNN